MEDRRGETLLVQGLDEMRCEKSRMRQIFVNREAFVEPIVNGLAECGFRVALSRGKTVLFHLGGFTRYREPIVPIVRGLCISRMLRECGYHVTTCAVNVNLSEDYLAELQGKMAQLGWVVDVWISNAADNWEQVVTLLEDGGHLTYLKYRRGPPTALLGGLFPTDKERQLVFKKNQCPESQVAHWAARILAWHGQYDMFALRCGKQDGEGIASVLNVVKEEHLSQRVWSGDSQMDYSDRFDSALEILCDLRTEETERFKCLVSFLSHPGVISSWVQLGQPMTEDHGRQLFDSLVCLKAALDTFEADAELRVWADDEAVALAMELAEMPNVMKRSVEDLECHRFVKKLIFIANAARKYARRHQNCRAIGHQRLLQCAYNIVHDGVKVINA